MFLEQVKINVIGEYLSFVSPTSRVFWLYLATAVILAFIAYLQFNHDHDDHDHEEDDSDLQDRVEKPRKGFLSYVFDKDVFLHPSTWQDVKYFLVNALVYYGVVAQFLIGMHGFSLMFSNGLESLFGQPQDALITSEVSLILYTILSVIAIDFGVYITHLAQHKVPVLWEFHKVHHSAEKLNPMTLFRMHPVDLLVTAFVTSLLGGLAFAGLFHLTAEEPKAMTLFGLNVIVFAFYIVGYNLRHSHIWLNYPVWLSKIFISPAQHQIHHSSDPKHFDRNMGLIFSFWDQLWGTHYIPRKFEKLTFGLSRDDPNPFNSVADIYLKPFVWAADLFGEVLGNPRRKMIAALAVCLIAVTYLNVSASINRQVALSRLPSVKLANLTWTEVEKALADGYDTVLIPTAGVEQNGPHVILGKHNVVVSHAAHRIANTLGHTLVAPTIDHVPEGAIEPKKEGHMQFAGTISLPDAVFEKVLEATARSLRAHGFKKIFFIGDSGGNQDAQEKVASSLQNLWANEGMIVAHIGNYYNANGQFDYLLNEGYTEAEIGYHAGIRDTSELLYIDSKTVRHAVVLPPQDRPTGHSGAFDKASAAIGRKMVALKVDAAVRQIEDILDQRKDQSGKGEIASIGLRPQLN